MTTWGSGSSELIMNMEPSVGPEMVGSLPRIPSDLIKKCLRRCEERRWQQEEEEKMLVTDRFIQELYKIPLNFENENCAPCFEENYNRFFEEDCEKCQEYLHSPAETCPRMNPQEDKERTASPKSSRHKEILEMLANDPYARYTLEEWSTADHPVPCQTSVAQNIELPQREGGEKDLPTDTPGEDELAAYYESTCPADIRALADCTALSSEWEERPYVHKTAGEKRHQHTVGDRNESVWSESSPSNPFIGEGYGQTANRRAASAMVAPDVSDTCFRKRPVSLVGWSHIKGMYPGHPSEERRRARTVPTPASVQSVAAKAATHEGMQPYSTLSNTSAQRQFQPYKTENFLYHYPIPQVPASGIPDARSQPRRGDEESCLMASYPPNSALPPVSSYPTLNSSNPNYSRRMPYANSTSQNHISANTGAAHIYVTTSGREGPQITVQMPSVPSSTLSPPPIVSSGPYSSNMYNQVPTFACNNDVYNQSSPMGSRIIIEQGKVSCCDPCVYSDRFRQKTERFPEYAEHGTMTGMDPRSNLCYLGRQAHTMSPKSFAGLLFSDLPPDGVQVAACTPKCSRTISSFPPSPPVDGVSPLPPPEMPKEPQDVRSSGSSVGTIYPFSAQPSAMSTTAAIAAATSTAAAFATPAFTTPSSMKMSSVRCYTTELPSMRPSSAPPSSCREAMYLSKMPPPSPLTTFMVPPKLETSKFSGISIGTAPTQRSLSPSKQPSSAATPLRSPNRSVDSTQTEAEEQTSSTKPMGLHLMAKSQTQLPSTYTDVRTVPSPTISDIATGVGIPTCKRPESQEGTKNAAGKGDTKIPPCEMPGAILVFRPTPVQCTRARPNSPLVQLELPGRGVVELTGEAVLFGRMVDDGTCTGQPCPCVKDTQALVKSSAIMMTQNKLASTHSSAAQQAHRLTTVDVTVDLSRVPNGRTIHRFSRTGSPIKERNESGSDPICVTVEPFGAKMASPLSLTSGVCRWGSSTPESTSAGSGGGGGLGGGRARSCSSASGEPSVGGGGSRGGLGGGGGRARSVSPGGDSRGGGGRCGGGMCRSTPLPIGSPGFLEELLRQLRERAGR